jgi:hypothetical protein
MCGYGSEWGGELDEDELSEFEETGEDFDEEPEE